jgi:hypothetical protein
MIKYETEEEEKEEKTAVEQQRLNRIVLQNVKQPVKKGGCIHSQLPVR